MQSKIDIRLLWAYYILLIFAKKCNLVSERVCSDHSARNQGVLVRQHTRRYHSISYKSIYLHNTTRARVLSPAWLHTVC